VKIDATGDSYDFSPNLDFDHYRRRRNLLLGHRQVCHRPPTCKSAEAARDTDLPRRHFATRAADDGNLLGRALSAATDRYQARLEGTRPISPPWSNATTNTGQLSLQSVPGAGGLGQDTNGQAGSALRRTARRLVGLGGSVIGGLAESFSTLLGFQHLLILAICFYILSAWMPSMRAKFPLLLRFR
jgi:hypothetical protein